MEKFWLEKSYPPGVPFEIDADSHESLAAMFLKNATLHSHKVAFINMGAQVTYGQLLTQATAFSAYLQQELGLVKGDKFAIMVPNLLQYPIAMYGALLAGLTVVNVNPLYTARELEHLLIDSESKSILILENFAHVLSEVVAKTVIKKVILTAVGDRLGLLKGTLINNVLRHVKKQVPSFSLPNTIKFNQVISTGEKLSLSSVVLNNEDLAFLQYTGGTTGPSKGVMLTHRNLIANIEQSNAVTKPIYDEGQQLMVTAIPLYHIFALTSNCLTMMTYGGTSLLITNPRDMPGFVKEIAKYPFTAISGVNTLFNGLLNTPGFSDIDFSYLRASVAGGMAVQRPVAEQWQKVTGSQILEAYGLTECAPLVTSSPYNQQGFSGSIGVPAPSTDIKLVDAEGKNVAMGEPGEMWIKGPQVMKGYYNRPDATAEAIVDGWFASGDIATMDENGFFKIVDRKKDMIIVSGFNVFPNEIEEVMVMHKGVLEAAVVGVPHEASGEMVKVYIVRKDPTLDEAAILAHAKKNLTQYKVPKLVSFIDEMPKTNVGKILRKELREVS